MPVQEIEVFRAKYPGYADMSDMELSRKLAAKYPGYRNLPMKVAQHLRDIEPAPERPGFFGTLRNEASAGFEQATTPVRIGGPPGKGILPSLNLPDPTNIGLGLARTAFSPIQAAAQKFGEMAQDIFPANTFGDVLAGGVSAVTQALGPGVAARSGQAVAKVVGKILPGSQAARTELVIDELKNSVLSLTAPTTAEELRATALTNPDKQVGAIKLYDTLKSIAKSEAGAANPDGQLINVVENLADKINRNGNTLSLAEFNREISDIGRLTHNLKSHGTEIHPEYARIFGTMAETLKKTPEGAMLRQSAEVYRREMAIEEILAEVDKVIIQKRGTTGLDIQANRLKKRLESRPYIRESFEPNELDDVTAIMEKLISMPAIPAPPSIAVGAGRVVGPIVGGFGLDVTMGLAPGTVAGPMALMSGTIEASRMLLLTKTGRTLLKRVLESGPLTITKVNILTSAVRGAAQLNEPPQ